MIKTYCLTFSLLFLNLSFSQIFYDSNDLKYYLDFSKKTANLKFQDYEIKGPLQEVISLYGNAFTLIKGDSIHWVLGQSEKKNKYSSYLIIKGEYKDILRLVRRESSSEKYEVLASDIIYSGHFSDFFNFVDENDFERIASNRLIGQYLKDYGLLGVYNIKIVRDNGINFMDLDINGKITLSEKDIVIETSLPTLTRLVGYYESELNKNLDFLKKGIVSGRILYENNMFYSLSIEKDKKIGTITTLEFGTDKDGKQTSKRSTTTFVIVD